MISLFAALLSLPAHADTLDCELARNRQVVALSSRVSEEQAVTKSEGNNGLNLELDSSLGGNTYFLVLQDNLKHVRAAFTGSNEAVGFGGSSFRNGESQVACRRKAENPSKAMPVRGELPDFFLCVLDEVKIVNGAIVASKRILRKATSTALFRLPQKFNGEAGNVAFSVRLHRMVFRRGLEVTLTDRESGASAQFIGPAGTLRTSFLMGLTQGDRAANAKFHRLGCAYANVPSALD